MNDRTLRALALGFLASTALATPAFAETTAQPGATQPTTTTQPPATGQPAPPPAAQPSKAGQVTDDTAIVITATKREEYLQNVPMSVQALGTRRLDQLNITNFEQYAKQLPSVAFQASQSGGLIIY